MQSIPDISVLMPVYNGERWLDAAIKSILFQSYHNFELLILLEYGSNKKSKEIVYGYMDNRIRVIENKRRLGLAASLNVGINEARGKYIARMDADDISTRNRLKKQRLYLESHPEIAICGTAVWKYRLIIGFRPHSPNAVRFSSFNQCVFTHPTVMWRKDEFIKNNLYYKEGIEAEDFELWTRVLDKCKGANLLKPLLWYRVSEESKSSLNKDILEKEKDKILKPYWERNGMRYYAPKCFCKVHGFQNDRLLHQEWRLLELVHKTEPFKGEKRIVRKIFFDFSLLESLQIGKLVRRYNELFIKLYSRPSRAKVQTLCYAVFRVVKIKFRPLLIKVLRR